MVPLLSEELMKPSAGGSERKYYVLADLSEENSNRRLGLEQPKDLCRFGFLLHPLFYIKFSLCFYSVALKATGWLYGSENTAQQELSTAVFTAEITVEVRDQLVYI